MNNEQTNNFITEHYENKKRNNILKSQWLHNFANNIFLKREKKGHVGPCENYIFPIYFNTVKNTSYNHNIVDLKNDNALTTLNKICKKHQIREFTQDAFDSIVNAVIEVQSPYKNDVDISNVKKILCIFQGPDDKTNVCVTAVNEYKIWIWTLDAYKNELIENKQKDNKCSYSKWISYNEEHYDELVDELREDFDTIIN